MENNSLLSQLKSLLAKAENGKLKNFMLLAIEADSSGTPLGMVIKSEGSPFTSLGMIDMLKDKLEDSRAEIFVRMEQHQVSDKELSKMPHALLSKLREFEERARKAADAGDIDELERIKAEAKIVLDQIKDANSKLNDKSDDSSDDTSGPSKGFNLDDFKGSF